MLMLMLNGSLVSLVRHRLKLDMIWVNELDLLTNTSKSLLDLQYFRIFCGVLNFTQILKIGFLQTYKFTARTNLIFFYN